MELPFHYPCRYHVRSYLHGTGSRKRIGGPSNHSGTESRCGRYLERTKKRTERERISDRSVTGVFSGSYAVNPFTGEAVPIWISDYVLAGYGTGAIMAVPAHDSRDYAFAKHFNLPIVPLVEGCDVSEEVSMPKRVSYVTLRKQVQSLIATST